MAKIRYICFLNSNLTIILAFMSLNRTKIKKDLLKTVSICPSSHRLRKMVFNFGKKEGLSYEYVIEIFSVFFQQKNQFHWCKISLVEIPGEKISI